MGLIVVQFTLATNKEGVIVSLRTAILIRDNESNPLRCCKQESYNLEVC